jgi:cellulose synthase operon protein C
VPSVRLVLQVKDREFSLSFSSETFLVNMPRLALSENHGCSPMKRILVAFTAILGLVSGVATPVFAQRPNETKKLDEAKQPRESKTPIGSKNAVDEEDERALAVYAEAANLQNGGAIEPAIESWKQFLKEYSEHPKAAEAAHYLGVCYMQSEPPQPAEAATAFEKALRSKTYELRQESLANLGWCLYSDGAAKQPADEPLLKKAIETFAALRKEFPKSEFSDRAIFYSGEAAYGLKQPKQAVEFYNELLALPKAAESSFRCDALYARGVALEELDMRKEAFASFDQLLSACADSELVTDVHLRRGDLAIMEKQYDKAIESFEAAIGSSDKEEDKAYAIYRQGFSDFAADRPAKAAERYEKLLEQFPKSPYAATATLAAGQSAYRGGNIDAAAKRFDEVLSQNNPSAATEAAHWLARIGLTQSKPPAQIEAMIRKQIERGLAGDFELELQLDLAEVISMDPPRIAESLKLFEEIYLKDTKAATAPRALYNAAFSALQSGDPKKSLSLAETFDKDFADHSLAADVRFIGAESMWASGQREPAADQFAKLATVDPKDHPQHADWVMRAMTALGSTGKVDVAKQLLSEQMPKLPPARQGEAGLVLGNLLLASGDADAAAKAFTAAANLTPAWPRADEAKLMSGQADLVAGRKEEATKVWNEIVQNAPQSRMADQARYKLAALSTEAGEHEVADKLYQSIIDSKVDPGLMPYALFSRAYGWLQMGRDKESLESLAKLRDEFPKHPVSLDALLTIGIAHRNLNQLDQSRKSLEEFLAGDPKGISLGHALYELSLVDQAEKKTQEATARLNRIVTEIPNYPDMDKVLYELGWAAQSQGNDAEAIKHFSRLTKEFPNTSSAPEALYFIAQRDYADGKFGDAAKNFEAISKTSDSDELAEKAMYRQGWSNYKANQLDAARDAFTAQLQRFPQGDLAFDAITMAGEAEFKAGRYEEALKRYEVARQAIRDKDESGKKLRDTSDSQIRELALLHGGQSAAQIKKYSESIEWYDELRERFPSTAYLPQLFYETGASYQQLNDNEKALKFFGQVADKYRTNEIGARARFMMGEIYFGEKKFDAAIPEFQRLMFGFGGAKAPESIRQWQAKAGFEAGRCSELLASTAATPEAKAKALDFARKFFQYVVQEHPQNELVAQSNARLEALKP